ncbi:hypothetical protein SUGI_0444350 [Cryptomeria japonica]|uniref:protein trichome birefringence-like 6 n=1 Tax=Cryptomeria japonica TaxID=3369 RepID=UPI002408D170|nr:protein trichome birefringence-like 6 [Cryptomeria japonica]GLJ23469.1 hypothetical protein SUGI_0444350 [Cryptomeria japonica]
MAYKGRSAEGTHARIRVVEWTAGIFMFCGLFIIWEGDQSWLQNAHIFQYCNAIKKNVNASVAVERDHHRQSNVTMEGDHHGQSKVTIEIDHHGQSNVAIEDHHHGQSNVTIEVDHHGQSNVAMEDHHHGQSNVTREVDHHGQSNVTREGDHHERSNVTMEVDHHEQSNVALEENHHDQNNGASQHNGVGRCNLFRGKWVYDESYVLYLNGSCPFASSDFNCRKNGRVDSDHERWRWQPDECDLPRFNASIMLEMLRNKRLVYVGDSINRNQWESMLCLLRVVVPHDGGKMKARDNGQFLQYFMKDYNCSIEFSWAPFLVRQNQNNGNETLKIDMIAEQSQHWKDASILVFNSGHWWTHEQPYEGRNYFEEGGQVIPYMEELTAFDKSLQTWAKWIHININPHKTQVYFRGYSPVHFHGRVWGKKTGGGCFNETEPIHKMGKKAESIYAERKRMEIVEKVVGDSKNGVKVKLLNVTGMSMYRKDAHASVYTSKYATMTNKNDYHYADCSHWCLPGLPDVWNNILYALLE